MITFQQKQALAEGILDHSIVKGSTHAFYRYPARFSPSFAKSAIETFTRPGDIVLDPFVGSGTTLVEAALSGRPSVGADVSSLATFISKVKTRPVSHKDATALVSWLDQVAVNARVLPGRFQFPVDKSAEQLSTIDGSAWPLRNLIGAILVELGELHTKPQRDFARAILSSSQWRLTTVVICLPQPHCESRFSSRGTQWSGLPSDTPKILLLNQETRNAPVKSYPRLSTVRQRTLGLIQRCGRRMRLG